MYTSLLNILFISVFIHKVWGKQCYACVPVFFLFHTDLEQNRQKLFLLALLKPIILQFFTILQDKLRSFNIQDDRSTRFLWVKIYRIHHKTFSWRKFFVNRDCLVGKLCSYVIRTITIIAFQWKRSKNSQNHLYGQPDGLSHLSSTKFAVPTVGAVWMNINRVRFQHDRELIMFRFYFPLFMVLLCVYL